MKWIFRLLGIFLLAGNAYSQIQEATALSSLPPCPSTGQKHNCFGTLTWPGNNQLLGRKYVGEFQYNNRNGLGILYRADGRIDFSGNWADGQLVRSFALDRNHFPFDPETQTPSAQPSSSQVDRVASEAQAARQRVQELEQQLALERQRNSEKPNENPRPQQQATPKPERRVALVIGNSTYKVSPLENPANDATDIAENLTKAGFKTTLIRNATLGQMRDATRRFADQLPSSDVALIYFAGHGIESNRKNYMIPVNADLKFEYELSDQAYDASVWLEMLESVKSSNSERVNIVILDACRNNTLFGARSLGRGLGRMDAPTGTFLAFSTAPGKVAADGAKGERNSPFTKHLLRAMQRPGLPIEEVFKEVRRNVSRETTGAQVPWESTSLTGFFAFR